MTQVTAIAVAGLQGSGFAEGMRLMINGGPVSQPLGTLLVAISVSYALAMQQQWIAWMYPTSRTVCPACSNEKIPAGNVDQHRLRNGGTRACQD